MAERSIVIGGGLAGIAAALRLADAGRAVVLFEKRPRLGGAAFSFQRGELSIDNGQHVFLRCCAAYRAFLDRVGATQDVTLQPRLDIPVLRPDGRRARLRRLPRVPAPAHLGAALAGYGLLGPADRARIVRAAVALRLLDLDDPRLDEQTLGDFLRRHGQSAAAIEALWGLFAVATLNTAPDEASLALAAKVFRTGLLDRADAADIGYAAVPLGQIHGTRAHDALQAAGVDVRLGHGVESVTADGALQAAGPSGEYAVEADDIVLALPHREALAVAPELAAGPIGKAAGLGASPIVNIHVVYDRRVTDLPFAAGVGTPVQWFFDRTDPSGVTRQHPDAQYLAVTVSAADDTIDRPSREVGAEFVAALARLLPAARSAQVLDVFVTRERRATFRQAPGTRALRPAAGAAPGRLWLAGAWTATGWPDTMEGAVRSGVAAAEAALRLPATQLTEYAA